MSTMERPGEPGKRRELIGSVAAGIAHDINNQLMLILNYLEMREPDRVREAANRCAAMTASLLSFCRGETRVMGSLAPAAFLRGFVGKAALPAGIVAKLEIPDGLPPIQADAEGLWRVLTNLISNACDAMEGAGTLWIRALPGAIQVEDSGPGIPEASLRRVFEPFFSTKGTRGTGLGLAVARDLMTQLGGSLTVHCREGRGACFELRFRS